MNADKLDEILADYFLKQDDPLTVLLKQELLQWHKDLTLELLGEDETIELDYYETTLAELVRNELRAELRKKLNDL